MSFVSVIVPCFNEERTIRAVLERIAAQDLSALGLGMEIIVVDDGSTDGGPAEVERFVREHPAVGVRVVSCRPNRGKGFAVRQGLDAARGEIVIVQDADLEYHPADYPALLAPILAGQTNVVYGSRRLRPGMPWSGPLYSFGAWLENILLHILYRTDVTDIATGYKVMRTDLLRALDLRATGFEFCPEVTAKLLNRGERIVEVPIRYVPRTKREGKKIRWPDFFIAVRTLLRWRFGPRRTRDAR